MKKGISNFLIMGFVQIASTVFAQTERPNVILLLTDDQGYGDIQSHGNPVLKTPNIDRLRDESVRFTDFHVAPMCSPTRGQLMSGLDAMRNGATAVNQGRSMVQKDVQIMPQFFAEAGYATGLFGKWHLGDSYPYLPRFRGFQEVVSFRGFGLTSLPDYWGNTYSDPVLMHNGKDIKYKGYCTDIFFNEAMSWIKKCQSENKPFFVYLPTNTPHVPEEVAEKYSKQYQGTYQNKQLPNAFYGMIANIDENIGKLEAFLKERGLRDNTILIFMSDNGTQNGKAQAVFNAGMRDKKRSMYEGGHRVPLFIRWKDGKLQHGTDIAELAEVQDLLPTLIELCKLNSGDKKFDGTSLTSLLKGKEKKLADRICVCQYNVSGKKWNNAVVMWDKWRLTGRNELYNIANDPGQNQNVCAEFPKVAERMNAYYDTWYDEAKVQFDRPRYIIVGSEKTDSVILYANDWQGDYCDNRSGLTKANGMGYWNIIVDQEATYEIELRRWPEESGKQLIASFDGIPGSTTGARPIKKAQLKIENFDQIAESDTKDTCVKFQVTLKAGNTKLIANFLDENGKELCSAMYVKVKKQHLQQ